MSFIRNYNKRVAKVENLGVVLNEEGSGPSNKAEILATCRDGKRNPNDMAESALLQKLSSQVLNLRAKRNADETAREISQLFKLKADSTSGTGALPTLATLSPGAGMPPPSTHFYEAVERHRLPQDLMAESPGEVAASDLRALPTFFFHTINTGKETLSMHLTAKTNGVYGTRAVDRIRRFIGSHDDDSNRAIVLSAAWNPGESLTLYTARLHEGNYKVYELAFCPVRGSDEIKKGLALSLNAQDWARGQREELRRKAEEKAASAAA